MRTRSFIALDLGSTKVTCLVGQPQGGLGGVEILGSGLASYPLMTSWPCEAALIARTIEQALEEVKLTQVPERVLVALTHPELSHRRVTAQIDLAEEPITIRAKDVARLKTQAVGQTLRIDHEPLLLETLSYAGNGFDGVRDPRGLMATRLSGTFQLVSMPVALRRAVVLALETVGFEVGQFVYSLQALAAGLDDTLAAKRVLLVDLGGCCTDLAIVDHGVLSKTSSVPWGGMYLAERLSREAGLTMAQAVTASLGGLSSPKPKVREVIKQQLPRLAHSLAELLRDEPRPESAVLSGRGALMDGLAERLEQMTGLPTVVGRSRHAQRYGELSRQIAFSGAIGLLELASQQQPPAVFSRPSGLLHAVLDRTKFILTEYF